MRKRYLWQLPGAGDAAEQGAAQRRERDLLQRVRADAVQAAGVSGPNFMGWKANCILITNREDGRLEPEPLHDTKRAIELARQLGLGRVRPVVQQHNCFMVYPKRLCIGAYEHGAVISFPVDPAKLFQHPRGGHPLLSVGEYFDPGSKQTARLLNAFPAARILCLILHSAVNQFGYAVYEKRQLIRARIGDLDYGVFVDEGTMLPEEEPLFAQSIIRDGKRVFILRDPRGEADEYVDDQVGENFVFALSRRFFGSRLDEDSPDEKLTAEEFERAPWLSFWK
ncbi:MAG: hypothetical protein U0992_06775 [Planctomycetaceae bacterium]